MCIMTLDAAREEEGEDLDRLCDRPMMSRLRSGSSCAGG